MSTTEDPKVHACTDQISSSFGQELEDAWMDGYVITMKRIDGFIQVAGTGMHRED